MNIFILDESVERCAQSHCDKHVTKMIVEYAQILCTTHRYLDGTLYQAPSNSGKTWVKYWLLKDKEAEKTLYKTAYVNHPCTIWARLASENYTYLYELWKNLCREYYFRYRKIHDCYMTLNKYLQHHPKKIMHRPGTEHPQCMPEEYKDKYYVHAYRNFISVLNLNLQSGQDDQHQTGIQKPLQTNKNIVALSLMLVLFQFRRYGYYAKGLVKAENLDKAAEALWNEPVGTFVWRDDREYMSHSANSLTVEEYKDEHGSDGKLSQKRNLEAKWASEFIANGSVTLEMVNMNKKIEKLAQEIKEDSENK